MSREAAAAINVQHLVELYRSGESEKALAERFGVDRGTIRKRLLSAGVQRRGISEAGFIINARRTPERRQEIVAAAHDAKRGKPNSPEALIAAALTRQRLGYSISEGERILAGWLAERGLLTTPQQAVGPYNCDLGAFPIAMEVFGGNFHASGDHARNHRRRCNYILDAGWHLVLVWDQTRDPLSVHAADYLVAFHKTASRDPSSPRQYRVIRGCGEELARGEGQIDEIAPPLSQRRTPRRRA